MGEEEDYAEQGSPWPPAWVREALTFVLCLVTAIAITVLIARPRFP
jgi:hypothetical protein